MSEEPIIINSVDVSECEFFIKTDSQCGCLNENDDMKLNDSGHFIYASCEFNPDCYYKQLKRIEQELKIQKQINKDCEIEYRRVVSQYNAVIDKGDIFDEYFEK